jgi:ABC-type antimicrobial peptide transport system permease subunit
VIGVVGSVRIDGPETAAAPQVYMPLVRRDGSLSPLPTINGGSLQFILRTSGPAEAVVPAIEATLARLAPPRAGRPGPAAMVVEDAFRNITADRRFNAGLMAIFGGFAFIIACAGVYGVMASVVAQQTREIGVRVALGASAARIRRDVVTQAGRYLLGGLTIGLPAAWLVSRAFGSLYFGVAPANPIVYLVVASALAGAGVLASALPARRASRVDPAVALKD